MSVLIFILLLAMAKGENPPVLPAFYMDAVYNIIQNACLLVGVQPVSPQLSATLQKLLVAFGDEQRVVVGAIDYSGFDWPSGRPLEVGVLFSKKQPPDLLFWNKRKVDRTCLNQVPSPRITPPGLTVPGDHTFEKLLGFINENCGTYRNGNGELDFAGKHRNDILRNLFHVEHVSDTTMGSIYSTENNPFNRSHIWRGFIGNKLQKQRNEGLFHEFHREPNVYNIQNIDTCEANIDIFTKKENYNSKKHTSMHQSRENIKDNSPPHMAQCDILSSPPSKEEFFSGYLKRSKPFIIRNITSKWKGFTKWTNQYLRKEFGTTEVHVKLTPEGDYEGVEKADIWENFKTFKIPKAVKAQLKFPDLVTVRPAGVSMNFSEFMDIINMTAQQTTFDRKLSAYLEYSSIPEYMPSMEKDVKEPEFARELLKRRHFNIWLSDGHTLGRLHFDQFDNLLCQISGTKQVTLFEPHNNAAMYEAHIQQATLTYSKRTKKFHRRQLEDSTSMVMSPVNLLQPDFQRFPLFSEMRPMNCTLTEGDVLYLPAFWWHEVQSQPSPTARRNLAVNFWYDPFLTREFPCQECTLDVNSFYRHLLYEDAV